MKWARNTATYRVVHFSSCVTFSWLCHPNSRRKKKRKNGRCALIRMSTRNVREKCSYRKTNVAAFGNQFRPTRHTFSIDLPKPDRESIKLWNARCPCGSWIYFPIFPLSLCLFPYEFIAKLSNAWAEMQHFSICLAFHDKPTDERNCNIFNSLSNFPLSVSKPASNP